MKKYLAKLNQIAENNNEGIAVVLEGRDTAGKSSTIRALTQYLSPAWYSVVPSTKPSKQTMECWLGLWGPGKPGGRVAGPGGAQGAPRREKERESRWGTSA